MVLLQAQAGKVGRRTSALLESQRSRVDRQGSERRAKSSGKHGVPSAWPSALRCGAGSGRGRAERFAAAPVTSCGAVQGAERTRGPCALRQAACGTVPGLNLGGRVRGAGVTEVSAVALCFLPTTCSGWRELHALLPQTRAVLTMVVPSTPEPPGSDSHAAGMLKSCLLLPGCVAPFGAPPLPLHWHQTGIPAVWG